MEDWARRKKLNYDLGNWFGSAWNLFKPHMWEFILLALVVTVPAMLIGGAFGLISTMDAMKHPQQNTNPFTLVVNAKQAILALGSALFGALVTFPLLVGVSAIALKALRSGVFDWDLLWTGFRKYSGSFTIGLISGAIMLAPSLFPLAWILFPLWLMVCMWGTIATFSLAEPGADGPTAMRKGIDIVRANIWWAALFELIGWLVSGAGIFACCIGIFFSAGFYYALVAVAYNDLSGQMASAPASESSIPGPV